MQAGIGATQLALLGKVSAPRFARAATPTGGPTRLLTFHLPGGFYQSGFFCPMNTAQINGVVPPQTTYQGDLVYFNASQVQNLDGSGDADGPGGYRRIRVPRQWDDGALSAGQAGASPQGYAWVHHKLWERCVVVHGVDQGTAGHVPGYVSAMCGVASNEYKSPGIHAWVANALFDRFGDDRPLASVTVGGESAVEAAHLRPEVSGISVGSTESIGYMASQRVDSAWAGFRNRPLVAHPSFDGSGSTQVPMNRIEERVARRLRAMRGVAPPGTDSFYESIYNSLAGVSKLLAKDVITQIENTPGFEHTPVPFWAAGPTRFSVTHAGKVVDGKREWEPRFEPALRLLKSGLTSAVSAWAWAPNFDGFDNHGEPGYGIHTNYVRTTLDVVGRFIGEMKATPIGGGRTLFDDTLIMIVSDFGRTNPKHGCEHWPVGSVVFTGANVADNRMVGNYETPDLGAQGFEGSKTDVLDGGNVINRKLTSADVVQTAVRLFGIDNAFIPGGSAEIAGVRG
jgi:hypothetical protein